MFAISMVATKRISAVVAGASLLSLLLLRLCPVFHPILVLLRIVPAWALLLFLPGFMLLNWLLPEMVHSCVETVPLALATSLAFWAPILFMVLMLAVSPATLVTVTLLALLLLFGAYLILASTVDERRIRLAPSGRTFWIVWCGLALSCALMIYRGGYMSGDATTYQLHVLRRVIEGSHLSRGYVSGHEIEASSYLFPLWHIVEALVSMLAGVEPAHVWYYGPAFLAPTSVLAVYQLAMTVFKSTSTACLSTPVYLLAGVYFQHLKIPGTRLFYCWHRANWPSAVNWLVLLPVGLTLVTRYLRAQGPRVWLFGAAFLVLAIVMGANHLAELFYLLVWLLVFLPSYLLLIGWDRRVLARSVGVLLVFAASFIAVLRLADAYLVPDQALSYSRAVRHSNERIGSSWARKGFSWSAVEITWPALVAATLLPPLVIVGCKEIPIGVALAFAGLVAAPLCRSESHILALAIRTIPNLWRMNYRLQLIASVLGIAGAVAALLPSLEQCALSLKRRLVAAIRGMNPWARGAAVLEISIVGALLIWLIARWQLLRRFGSVEPKLSPVLLFAYLALMTLVSFWLRIRPGVAGTISRARKMDLRYPPRTFAVVVACAVLLVVPGLLLFGPFKARPLLPSTMNTETGAVRFSSSSQADKWWDPELIGFLREHSSENAVIWAQEWPSRLIPVYVNRHVKQVKWTNTEGIEELRGRDPTYLLFLRPSHAPPTDMSDLAYLSSVFQPNGQLFEQVYESTHFRLFRMSSVPQRRAERQINQILAGNAYLVEEEWDQAIAEYKAALALDPDDSLAHLGLGRAYQAQGEMGKAMIEFESAVAPGPEYSWPLLYLGQAHAELAERAETGRRTHLQEAAAAYRRSWARNKGNIAAQEHLLEVCEELTEWCQQAGIFDEMATHLAKAAQLDPTDEEWQVAVASWYQAAGRYEEAVGAWLRVLNLRPRNIDAYISLGEVYLAQGKMEDAATAFERAIRLDFVQGHASAAQLYEREGWPSKAIIHYLAAADAAEGHTKANALREVGQIYQARGQLNKAVAHYLTAAQATVDSGTTRTLYQRVADMYLAADDPEAARSLVRSVLWNERKYASSWSLAADVYPALIEWYEKQGKVTKARAIASELLDIVPGHEAALQTLTHFDFVANFNVAEVEAAEESSPHVRLAEFTMPSTGDRRAVLLVPPQARVSYGLELPPEPSVLRFGLAMNPESWDLGGDGSTFEVWLMDEGGARRLLFSEHVGNDPEERKWHDREVSLTPYAGQEVTITFTTQPGPAGDLTGDQAGWATPRVTWAQTEEGDKGHPGDFWDYSKEEISAANAFKTSPASFTKLYPLD